QDLLRDAAAVLELRHAGVRRVRGTTAVVDVIDAGPEVPVRAAAGMVMRLIERAARVHVGPALDLPALQMPGTRARDGQRDELADHAPDPVDQPGDRGVLPCRQVARRVPAALVAVDDAR